MTFLSNLIIHEEGQYLTGSLEGFVGGFHWIIIFFLLLVSLSLDVFPLTGDMLETPQHFMSFILQLLSLSSLWNTILGSSHTRAWGGRIRAIPTQWCQREPRVERPGWSREFNHYSSVSDSGCVKSSYLTGKNNMTPGYWNSWFGGFLWKMCVSYSFPL